MTATDGVSVCIYACAHLHCMCRKVCVLLWCCHKSYATQKYQEELLMFVFHTQPLSLAVNKPVAVCRWQYSSSTAAVVQRQPCSELSPLCQSRCMCVWLVNSGRRRSNHDNIFTSYATMKHTSSGLIPGVRSIQQQQQKQ